MTPAVDYKKALDYLFSRIEFLLEQAKSMQGDKTPIARYDAGHLIFNALDTAYKQALQPCAEAMTEDALKLELMNAPVYSRRKLEAERDLLKRQLEAAVDGYNRILEEYKDSDRNSMHYRWSKDTLAKIKQIGDGNDTLSQPQREG